MMRSFGRDNKGGVAMLFAIALVPMMAIVGAAIDYGAAMRASAALGAAADAAALTAIAPGSAAYQQAAATNGDLTLTVDSTPFTNLVKANLGNRRDMTVNTPTVTLVKAGGKITATVTYTASVQTSIMSLFGFSSVPIRKVAVASINMQTYMDFYMLLDNSPSMGIAATPADIATMVANTSDQCAFACHDISDKNNYYNLAKKLGVTMRIDLLRSATQNLMTTATSNEAGASLFRFAVYTFGTTADVAHGAALSNVVPLSSNLSSVATQAANID
jgi:Flp pilus assembly protein TadG